jgi:hypothetical protein
MTIFFSEVKQPLGRPKGRWKGEEVTLRQVSIRMDRLIVGSLANMIQKLSIPLSSWNLSTI